MRAASRCQHEIRKLTEDEFQTCCIKEQVRGTVTSKHKSKYLGSPCNEGEIRGDSITQILWVFFSPQSILSRRQQWKKNPSPESTWVTSEASSHQVKKSCIDEETCRIPRVPQPLAKPFALADVFIRTCKTLSLLPARQQKQRLTILRTNSQEGTKNPHWDLSLTHLNTMKFFYK